MRKTIQASVLGAILSCAAAAAFGGPDEVANKAANGMAPVVTKTESAVKHGLQKTAKGVEHGVTVAGKAVSRTAKKLGLPSSEPGAAAPQAQAAPEK